jgi:hypothetical protein
VRARETRLRWARRYAIENAYKISVAKPEGRRDHFADLNINERKLQFLKKCRYIDCFRLVEDRISMAGCWENVEKVSDFVKCDEILDQLNISFSEGLR